MPQFNEVGMAILSERKYQDAKWGDNLDKGNTLSDYISYMQSYLNAVKEAPSDEEKMHRIRKVTAIGVKAMEVFGAPHREGFECSGAKACPTCPMDERCELTEEITELSPEELDAIIAQEQEAVKVERGVYYRVNESERVYIYDAPDQEHCITNVRAFAVMPSGGHRLLDNEGTWYYVQPGWRVLVVPKAEVV